MQRGYRTGRVGFEALARLVSDGGRAAASPV